MGALTAVASLVAFAFQNLGGWIVDKYLVGRERILICIMLSVAGCAVFFMYTAESIGIAFTWLTIATTAIAVTSPVIFALALKYLPEAFIGTGTGIANFGQQIAGMLAPTIFGYFIHVFHGSYLAVFIFVIVTVVIAFMTALTVNTSGYSESGQQS
jgi:MFS family permease